MYVDVSAGVTQEVMLFFLIYRSIFFVAPSSSCSRCPILLSVKNSFQSVFIESRRVPSSSTSKFEVCVLSYYEFFSLQTVGVGLQWIYSTNNMVSGPGEDQQ